MITSSVVLIRHNKKLLDENIKMKLLLEEAREMAEFVSMPLCDVKNLTIDDLLNTEKNDSAKAKAFLRLLK